MRVINLTILTLAIAAPVLAMSEGGPAKDGKEVAVDLPVQLRRKNIGGSDGAGLCVFTSIGHSAEQGGVDALKDFQHFMSTHPGGGWPEKVDKMIAACAKQHNAPTPLYVQYEGKDDAIVRAALANGWLPACTYDGRDMHYGAHQHVEHMTNTVLNDGETCCVLDNNFIGANQLVWLSHDEWLSRWYGGSGRDGWAVVLISDGSIPPMPHN